MATRTSHAEWRGDLKSGDGDLHLGSGRYSGPYTFVSRFGSGEGGTSPEELLAAAHAACFSMALSNQLAQAGTPVESVKTEAAVHVDAGVIFKIELSTVGRVPGIDEAGFLEQANAAKEGCPVSKLFAGGSAEIMVEAKLET